MVFLRNMVVFNYGFCFPYISFLLLLSFQTDRVAMMIWGFVLGILLDVFYDTLGIHAAACVLLGFIRKSLLNMIIPNGGYDSGAVPTLKEMGFRWFFVYTLSLTFTHHLIFFLIEASDIKLWLHTLTKVIASTLITSIAIIAAQYVFYMPTKRR